MAVNWALGLQQGPNPGERFADAFKQGQETARQNKARAAMAALARDPSNKGALAALAEADPETAMTYQTKMRDAHLKELDAHRDSIKIGAQVIRAVKPRDEATWQQTRFMYAQAGGDLTGIPEHWDDSTATYVQNVSQLADSLAPEKVQLVPFQPGGGVLRYNPTTGAQQMVVIPNDDPSRAGQPVTAANAPQPGTIVADPRLQGGATGAAPSPTFPGTGY